MTRQFASLCLLPIFLFLWPAAGIAQTGSVAGSVVDQTGLVLPPVQLQLASFGDTVVVTASRAEVRLLDAFWSDVLTAGYHGYTDGYATVNGSFGVKWQGGTITTTVKVNNLFNQTDQQHIFGDLLRRTVLGEIKFRLQDQVLNRRDLPRRSTAARLHQVGRATSPPPTRQ